MKIHAAYIAGFDKKYIYTDIYTYIFIFTLIKTVMNGHLKIRHVPFENLQKQTSVSRSETLKTKSFNYFFSFYFIINSLGLIYF